LGAGLVILREGFEASLVVGIVLAFLDRTGRRDAFRPVWIGAFSAFALSAVVAALLFAIGAELRGRSEQIFEGLAMLAAAALLTWMIFWMRRQARTIRHELEAQVEHALATGSALALAFVAFIGVLREGVETALFLYGTVSGTNALVSTTSAAAGLAGALLLGYLFYRGASRLDLRRFFTITSTLLLLFAGWLLARGLHELSEGGLLPESTLLLLGAFVALAGPTLYFFLRWSQPSGRAAVRA
jgi:high-affinity iron transporter